MRAGGSLKMPSLPLLQRISGSLPTNKIVEHAMRISICFIDFHLTFTRVPRKPNWEPKCCFSHKQRLIVFLLNRHLCFLGYNAYSR